MSLVVGYNLSHPFAEHNFWIFVSPLLQVKPVFVLLLPPETLCLAPPSRWTSFSLPLLTVCLRWTRSNLASVSKQRFILLNGPLCGFCSIPPEAILCPEQPVSPWQVQWPPGCGSRLNTWACILSGTWWLDTGAAYRADSFTGSTAAGERERERERGGRDTGREEGMGAGKEGSDRGRVWVNWS